MLSNPIDKSRRCTELAEVGLKPSVLSAIITFLLSTRYSALSTVSVRNGLLEKAYYISTG